MNDPLLTILRCPVSGQKFSFEAVEKVFPSPASIPDQWKGTVTRVMLTQAGDTVYPLRGRIMDLRPDSGISIAPENNEGRPVHQNEPDEATRNVQKWYDTFGWVRNEEGVLNDSAYYSHREDSSYGLYERMSHLLQAERFSGGEFLLDAASGALAHPEYLSYSSYHKYRVCVDFSETALQEASRKLGDHGLFVLADICALPFVDDVFDGVISGYTVQHILKERQLIAIRELYRVMKPGNRLCILASQETGKSHEWVLKLARWISALAGHRRGDTAGNTDSAETSTPVTPPYQLYGHCWPYRWWCEQLKELDPRAEVHALRLFGKPEFEVLRFGPVAVRRIRGLETLFSRALGGASSLIVTDVPKGPVK